jgi:hypothetical protein
MATSRGQLILDQCDGLRKLMKEIPRNAPNFSIFNNRIVEVENTVKTDVEAADDVLQALYRDLRDAPDGMGGRILDGERHRKFFDILDEDTEPVDDDLKQRLKELRRIEERLRTDQQELDDLHKKMKEQLLAGATVEPGDVYAELRLLLGRDSSSKNPDDYDLILGYVS